MLWPVMEREPVQQRLVLHTLKHNVSPLLSSLCVFRRYYHHSAENCFYIDRYAHLLLPLLLVRIEGMLTAG